MKIAVHSFSRFLTLSLLVMAVIACNSPHQKEMKQVLQSADSIQSSSERKINTGQTENFISVLKTINISNINQFISPKEGVWLIQSSGAMPNMSNTSQVDKNFPVDFSNCKEEELPKINCDAKTFWTKEGCYVQKINSFKDEKVWTYASLSKEDEAKVEEQAKTIQYTVINTSNNARYYFSFVDGKWYLSFVDLRKPCEA